jgi:glycosyltransferase involved in cell wall biosynthesis
MIKQYDVCIIAFVDIATDARTLNISGTFAKFGYSVAVIGLNNIELTAASNVDFFGFQISNTKRTWQRWLEFHKKASSIIKTINTKNVFAEDIYSLPIASKLVKQNNAQLIYDSREIYSAIGPLSSKSFKQKFISFTEKKYIKNVSKIIVTAERDAKYLYQHLTNKIEYITIKNLPPYKEKLNTDIIRKKFGIPSHKKIVIYQGMLLKGRGIKKTIEAVSILKNTVFVILGDGPLRNTLEQIIENKNLKEKIFLAGAIEYDKLHEWTCSADLGITLIEPISKSYELALPNKLFEYIMARIPSLCTNLLAMKEITDKYNTGKYINYNLPPSQIAQIIKDLLVSQTQYITNCDKAAHILSFEKQNEELLNCTNLNKKGR